MVVDAALSDRAPCINFLSYVLYLIESLFSQVCTLTNLVATELLKHEKCAAFRTGDRLHSG